MVNPLVSAIMPTAGRPQYARQAAEMFLAQTWPNKELVVIDDGSRETPLPDDPAIRYIRVGRQGALGAKRNLACSHARGEFICHWDDDDAYAPDRIEDQAVRLLANPRIQLTGYHTMPFYSLETGEEWLWRYSHGDDCIGVSAMYRREFWREHRFNPEKNIGEEYDLINVARGNGTFLAVDGERRIVATIHRGNTAPRDMSLPNWEYIGVRTEMQVA